MQVPVLVPRRASCSHAISSTEIMTGLSRIERCTMSVQWEDDEPYLELKEGYRLTPIRQSDAEDWVRSLPLSHERAVARGFPDRR